MKKKLTPLDLIKEDYSYGTWKELCEEFGISLEEDKITIYYDSSLTEGMKEEKWSILNGYF